MGGAGTTVGVEEEFLLVNPRTGRTTPCADAVLARCGRAGRLPPGASAHRELRPTQLELATGVCTEADELRAQLTAGRRLLAEAAAAEDCALVASGTPVNAPGRGETPEPEGRFAEIHAAYGPLAADYEACGCHVHVGVADRDTAVAVVNHLAPWLPALLALSANSPFADGHDTGYHSWRMVLQTRFPGSGVAPNFAGHTEYQQAVDALVACGALVDREQSFWLARPSPRFPTVELRVADTVPTVDDTVLQAVLSRALVRTALADLGRGVAAPSLSPQVCAAAVWAAARHGLTAFLVDPVRQRQSPAAEVVRDLLAHVSDALEDAGDRAFAETHIQTLLTEGTGAVAQRAAAADDLPAVVRLLEERTVPVAGHEAAAAG
ncbi:glutamate--cysteine ligase [Amycolatopsis sp. FDAARGOS 1241]|uniref:carboxylate-amine ligase n=1 Tax=Amycolatopsis sp. FDAARGOS 1241 TaxID=2778070 RepID=UPI0019526C43|nr:glutamate--cysteine ligase [Amycolatopsis sp. FDAARGOS 1241]QRP49690.1 glutamate--cysteine ligase [Amycolatopsis sp. FDAARGOS 1241]